MSVWDWIYFAATGTILVVSIALRSAPEAPPPVPRVSPERPWLTREAAAQVVREDGGLGPLFDGLTLGGPPPSPELRARLAAFAAANHVNIDVEVADDEVVAVRFDVTFGGCCGYEGADVFALRLYRPHTGSGCSDAPGAWFDDWALVSEDGAHLRARVRVNRVLLRWEREIDLSELVERADGVLGGSLAAVADEAGERWASEGGRYLLEVPYAFDRHYPRWGGLASREDLGISLTAARDRIVGASFVAFVPDEEHARAARATLRARWGRPRVRGDAWTWKRADRTITATFEGARILVSITAPGAPASAVTSAVTSTAGAARPTGSSRAASRPAGSSS